MWSGLDQGRSFFFISIYFPVDYHIGGLDLSRLAEHIKHINSFISSNFLPCIWVPISALFRKSHEGRLPWNSSGFQVDNTVCISWVSDNWIIRLIPCTRKTQQHHHCHSKQVLNTSTCCHSPALFVLIRSSSFRFSWEFVDKLSGTSKVSAGPCMWSSLSLKYITP